jgi:hypothetical protein
MSEQRASYGEWPAVTLETNAPHTTAAALSAILDDIEADWIDQRITEVLREHGKVWVLDVDVVTAAVRSLMAPYRARLAALVEG